MIMDDKTDAVAEAREQEEKDVIEEFVSKLDKDNLVSEEAMRWLASADGEIDHFRRYTALLNRAGQFKLRSHVDSFIKGKKLHKYTPPKQPTPTVTYAHEISLLVEGNTVTRSIGSWVLSNWRITRDDGDRGIILGCRGRILIVRRLKDKNERTEFYEIAWQEKEKDPVRVQIVPRASIASKTEILKLASMGMPVSSDVAGALVSFLADMAELNEIETVDCTGQMGWSEDMSYFAPYDKNIRFYDQTQSLLSRSVRTCGEYKIWLDLMRKIRQMGRVEPMLCMAAAFAAPIVQMVDGQTGVVNLSRETGTGKSVSMACGASIYGYPEKGHMIIDAGSTANSAEGVMETMKNLPAFFDDLSRAENAEKAVQGLIYTVCTECSKGRKTRDAKQRRILTWRTIAQTNYERGLASLNVKDGMLNRAYDYRCDDGKIFGDDTTPNSSEVMTTILHNYGHAGWVWIHVLKRLGAEALREEVNEMRKILKQAVADAGEKPKSGKQLNTLALIMVADKLSQKYIFKDKKTLPMARMLEDCKSEIEVFEPAKAYSIVGELVSVHMANFIADDKDDSTLQRFGSIDGDWVNINPFILRKWASENNFDIIQLCKWLLSSYPDLIETDVESDRTRYQKKISESEKRVYRLKLWQKVNEDEDSVITEEQARRARVMKHLYDGMEDVEKLNVYHDPVFTRFLLKSGFEADDDITKFRLKPATIKKIEEIEKEEEKARKQAENMFMGPPEDEELPF